MTSYPNKEHQRAHESATRRALAAIRLIRPELDLMEIRLTKEHASYVDGSDASRVISLAGDLREYLTVIETLREVREWDAADLAERARGPVIPFETVPDEGDRNT